MRAESWRAGVLAGRTVIVTGGGTGLGAACAERLARDGAAVVICGRTESRLVDAASRIAVRVGEAGPAVRLVVADVTSDADVARLVELTVAETGRLDGVVSNAGGGQGPVPLHLSDVAEFTRVLHLNVLSALLLLQHSVPHLVAAGGGSFVGMSSISAGMTKRFAGGYTVAKAGLEQLMRNAADEYGEVQVRFNAVRPGFISTEVMENLPRDSAIFNSYVENTPMGDVGEPEDVADLVRFLIGPESRWITGQIINVDGGHSLRRGPDFAPAVDPVYGHDVVVGSRRPSTG